MNFNVSAINDLLLLQTIVESIPQRIFWKDLNLRYIGCNTLFAKDAGFSRPEELIGKDDYQMGWKDQAERYRADDMTVIKSGKSTLNYEEPQTSPNGSIIWLSTSKVPLKDSSNQIIGVIGIYEDITERKQALETIRHLASFPKLDPTPIMEVDSHGDVSFVNPAAQSVFPDLLPRAKDHPLVKCAFQYLAELDTNQITRTLEHELHYGDKTYELHMTLVSELKVIRIYIHDITLRKTHEDRIYELATLDSLTKVLNRRAFQDKLTSEIQRSQRYATPMVLLMFDIDHFKEVNDNFGHEIGDHVLANMAALVEGNLRKSDTVGRWGGEEFMILLPQLELHAAMDVAEKIRRIVENHVFINTRPVTISLGLTTLAETDDVNTIAKRVDDAMYLAKKRGRNRVEVLTPENHRSDANMDQLQK